MIIREELLKFATCVLLVTVSRWMLCEELFAYRKVQIISDSSKFVHVRRIDVGNRSLVSVRILSEPFHSYVYDYERDVVYILRTDRSVCVIVRDVPFSHVDKTNAVIGLAVFDRRANVTLALRFASYGDDLTIDCDMSYETRYAEYRKSDVTARFVHHIFVNAGYVPLVLESVSIICNNS